MKRSLEPAAVFGEKGGGLARIVAFVIAIVASKTFSMTSRSSGLPGATGPVLPFATIDRGQTELLMVKVGGETTTKGFLASFLRPNANHLINREDEDYSVANLVRAARRIASTALWTRASETAISNFTLGMKALLYSLP